MLNNKLVIKNNVKSYTERHDLVTVFNRLTMTNLKIRIRQLLGIEIGKIHAKYYDDWSRRLANRPIDRLIDEMPKASPKTDTSLR